MVRIRVIVNGGGKCGDAKDDGADGIGAECEGNDGRL